MSSVRQPGALTAILLETCNALAAAAQPDQVRPDDTDSEDFRPVGQRTTTVVVHGISTLVSTIASEIRETNPHADYFTLNSPADFPEIAITAVTDDDGPA